MNQCSTILGSKLTTALCVNGLFVPANSIGSALISFVSPGILHAETGCDVNFGKSGSAFHFQYRKRFFAIATAHQLEGADPEQFSILSSRPLDKRAHGSFVTSQSMIFDETKGLDLCLFEFTEPRNAGCLATTCFYKASGLELFDPTPAAEVLLVLGFPGELSSLNFDDLHFKTQGFFATGEMVEQQMKERLSLRLHQPSQVCMDGMSGGTVFGIRFKDETPCLFWAGIIANSSRQIVNFIPTERIGSMINNAFAT